jgi:hypothetical protein
MGHMDTGHSVQVIEAAGGSYPKVSCFSID